MRLRLIIKAKILFCGFSTFPGCQISDPITKNNRSDLPAAQDNEQTAADPTSKESPSTDQQESPISAPSKSALDQMLKDNGLTDDIPPELKTPESLGNGNLWEYLKAKRESALKAYLESHKQGFDAFTKNPVTYNGTPAVIFRLLPEVTPEVFSREPFEAATGYFFVEPKDSLPYGFAYTKPPATPGSKPSPLLVTLTCAACHTGKVQDSSGKTHMLIGAPSRIADINGYRSLLTSAVESPLYTLERFTSALAAKKPGELYGKDRIAEETIDKAIFLGTTQSPALGAVVLQQFKEGLFKRREYAAQTVGAYTLKNDLRTLGHLPGRIDFPIAVTLALAPVSEVQADPAAALQKYFATAPGIGDIMSVWRQDKRVYAQWDGNLKTKLTRNLGAELGIAGDPAAVNFTNGPLTTDFVEGLPSPPYPFKVNLAKAAQGRAIYASSCAGCHDSEKLVPLPQTGTDPGRALGITKDTRTLLVKALQAACSDKTVADCNAPENEIVVPRFEQPGYISVPLEGIWARAPYFHNGSVPTLYHVLVPEERPDVFQLNRFTYDEKQVGFSWKLQNSKSEPAQNSPNQGQSAASRVVSNDTKIPGLGHQGHSDKVIFQGGIDFRKEPAKLEALLEYLKTL